MKNKVLSSLVLLLVFCKPYCQSINQNILDNYSSDVVNKMFDIVTKTNVNSDQQIAIADILQNQANQVAQLIKNGATKRTVDSVNALFTNSWKALLNASEQFNYNTETFGDVKNLKYNYYLLSTALKNSNALGLLGSVVEYLKVKVDTLKNIEDQFYQQNPTQVFNSYSLQNGFLNNVLTDSQYLVLIQITKTDKAQAKAKEDWAALAEFHLAEGLNEDSTMELFRDFYIMKDFIYGRFQKNNALKRKYLQRLYAAEPDPVRKLYYARKYKNAQANNRATEFSQLLFAIKNTDRLSLTEEQVKILLEKSNELQNLKNTAYLQDSSKPFESRPYECTQLKSILTGQQFDLFLAYKNTGKVKNKAIADWAELVQRNITFNHNRDSTLTIIANYYFQRQAVYDKYADDAATMNDLLKTLYANRPPMLVALGKARQSPYNNTMNEQFIW